MIATVCLQGATSGVPSLIVHKHEEENDAYVVDLKIKTGEDLDGIIVTSARVYKEPHSVKAIDAQMFSRAIECLANKLDQTFAIAERKVV